MTNPPDRPVRTLPVALEADAVPLAGELFLPAVVCTGTWTSVRQRMTDRCARRLAAAGFAAPGRVPSAQGARHPRRHGLPGDPPGGRGRGGALGSTFSVEEAS